MKYLIPLLLLSGCSSAPTFSEGHHKDGSPVYSAHGFMVGYHMYYWRPWFAKAWFGKDPIPPYDRGGDAPDSPMAKGWVVRDETGVHVAPALYNRLKQPNR